MQKRGDPGELSVKLVHFWASLSSEHARDTPQCKPLTRTSACCVPWPFKTAGVAKGSAVPLNGIFPLRNQVTDPSLPRTQSTSSFEGGR